jgi:hypothetical protein
MQTTNWRFTCCCTCFTCCTCSCYSADQIFWHFRKAVTAFEAAKYHGCPEVHTGGWGTGVFNNSCSVMLVIQALVGVTFKHVRRFQHNRVLQLNAAPPAVATAGAREPTLTNRRRTLCCVS